MTMHHGEEASDARFNVPYMEKEYSRDDLPEPTNVDPELFTHRPERGQDQVYVDPNVASGFTVPESMRMTPMPPPMTLWSGPGLVWRMAPGQELPDIGRCFSMPDALQDFHSVDLRTILAHLDSAAHAVKMELDTRYRNGGR